MKHVSSFSQKAQWLEHMDGDKEAVGTNAIFCDTI